MDFIVKRFLMFCDFLINEKKVKNHTEIAQKIGISSSMMTDIKKGRTRLGAETINGTITAFSAINPHWLLKGEGEMLNSEISPDNYFVQTPEFYNLVKIVNKTQCINIGGKKHIILMPLININDKDYCQKYTDAEFVFKQPNYPIIEDSVILGSFEYTAFVNSGNDMNSGDVTSLCDKDILIGILEEKESLKKYFNTNSNYIIVHKEKIFVRRIEKYVLEGDSFICKSLNPNKGLYPDLTIQFKDINQIFLVARIQRNLVSHEINF